ncbi:hypothetical protein M2S00_00900 [Apilactobacillus sp. TMW 2.2459]|uniref:helix-turn-helix domain-containing protein n=1 Tax=Apilactobacillus xinyiensis TaxID=2841032 RepID=UPI00200E0C56|nr:helix-turn-helix domain-containing protein [Apilactobacillus xinyiensis]MCL0311675.1 hypothetical protein [Apilactobacillus xinyiensis]
MKIDDEFLILLFSYNQPRRPKLIENLLAGRKTVSTLFWGMRYRLLDYCGVFSKFKEFSIISKVHKLEKNGYLRRSKDNKHLLLTKLGLDRQKNLIDNYYLPKHLDVYQKYNVTKFSKRFLLAVQIVSEYSFHNKQYFPLQMNILEYNLIKNWFKNNKKTDFILKMHRLLYNFADSLDNQRAIQFATALTGHKRIALTNEQQKSQLNVTSLQLYFMQLDLFSELIIFIKANQDYNFLYPLLSDLNIQLMGNASFDTFKLLIKGNSINKIAHIKHIKTNTVKEHLLNAAIVLPKTAFPYSLFLNNETIKFFKHNLKGNIDEWSFVTIKQTHISFFDFRLYQIFRSKH